MKIALFFLLFIFFQSCTNIKEGGKSDEITHSAQGDKGIVAAGKQESVKAGLDILSQGGNAVDAAVATILAETVTEFGDFCIGGEVAFMFFDASSGKVKVISGQGRAPLDPQAIDWYYQNGIPESDIKAAPVPAVIGLSVTALQNFGTITFEESSLKLIELLQTREKPWYQDLEKTINKLIEAEKLASGSRVEKLQAVAERFYRGDIADSLALWYEQTGSFLTKKDLENFKATIEDPVVAKYREYDVYKCQTWTQGPMLLQTLNLLENYDLTSLGHNSADYIHLLSETMKLAFADRDEFYGDPEFTNVPLEALLSESYTEKRLALIDMNKASLQARPGDPYNLKALLKTTGFEKNQKGTTTCAIVDPMGNVVVATPSGWGSKAGAGGGTGITHSTRLRSLNLKKGHPNSMEPGKRPRITITPTLVMKEGKPVLAISVEGGDVQEQTTLNLLLNVLEFGMTPEEAVSAPRFSTNFLQDSFTPDSDRSAAIPSDVYLLVNPGLDESILTDLRRRGHKIEESDKEIGAPAIILIDSESGRSKAATDPKIEHYTGKIN